MEFEIGTTPDHEKHRQHPLHERLDVNAGDPEAMLELAAALRKQGRHRESVAVLESLTRLIPGNARAMFRLATALDSAALCEAAVQAYRRCLELAPCHSGALLGLGHSLKALGRLPEAVKAYQYCMASNPDRAEAYYSLANLKTFDFSDAAIEDMRQRLANCDTSDPAAIYFFFTLARAYENRKNYDAAWRYYSAGNAAQRNRIKYDPEITRASTNKLIQFFSQDFFTDIGRVGHPDASPIFIVGMPRSGSTLVEQIIASHSQVEGTAELPYVSRLATTARSKDHNETAFPEALGALPASEISRLGDRYLQLSKMHRVLSAPRFIDKMPNNFMLVGFIHCILPNAKIIDVRRNPLDACVGNLKQFYPRGQHFTYTQADIGKYCLQYRRIMEHWDTVLPGKVLRVQYEDTVEDLESQARRILAFLELPWEENCLNYHKTQRVVRSASSAQVRRPIYSSAIGYWKNFEKYLGELLETLAPLLEPAGPPQENSGARQ